MYSVSNDYLNKITSASRTITWYGTITLTNGTVINFDTTDIAQGGLSVSADVSSDENPTIGNAFSSELRLNLYTDIDRYALYGAEVVPYFRLYLTENTYEDVPLGKFYVSEATRTSSMVSMICYDAMTKMDSVKVVEDQGEATPYTWISAVVQRAGLTLGTTSADIADMPNGNRNITFSQANNTTLNDMTCRDALGYLCGVLCANAYIGRDGSVYVKEYGMTAVETIGTSGRFTSSFADYTTEYTAVSLNVSAVGTTEYYADSPDDGLTFDLGANPWLQAGSTEGRETVCRAILGDLDDIAYVPFEVDIPVRPEFDIIDVLSFTGGQASSAIGAIVSLSYSSSGSMTIKCTGANPRLMGVKTKTEKAIEQIQNTVAREINEMSVVQNSTAVTIAENTETSILKYNFEVTQEENTTMVDVSVVMTATATEQLVGEIYTLGDIVAALTFYVDNSQVTVYDPTFIVDEGKDTMTFNFSLSGLSVGAHEFDIRLTVGGGSGAIAIGDIHELLWGYGITFEVYAKGIEITTLPTKTVYYVGQRLDYSGLVVSEYFNNGTKVGVSTLVNLDPVSGTLLTDDDVGTLTVDADYDGFFADFDVTVRTLGFEFVMSEDIVPEAIRYNFSGNFEELSTGLHWLNVNFTTSYNLNLRSAQLTVGNDGIVDVSNGQDLTVNTRADRKWVAAKNGDYIFFFGSTQTQISSSYFEFYAEPIYPMQSSPSAILELVSDDQPTWNVFSVYINGSGYSGGDPFAGWNMFFIDGYLVMPNIKFAYRTSTSNFVAAFGYGIEVSDNHFVLHIKADSYETETGRNDEIRNLLRGAVKGTSQFRYGANGGSKEYILDNPKYCQIVKKIDGQNYIEIYRLHCTDNGVTYTLIDRFETNLIDYETYSWSYSDSPKAYAIHGTDNFYVYGIGSNMATYYMGFYDVTANTYSEWIVTNASLVPQGVKEYCYDATSGLYFYVCPTSLLGSTELKQVLFASADLQDWTKFEYTTDFFNKITDGQIVHNGNIVVVGRTDNDISGNKICGVYFKEVG